MKKKNYESLFTQIVGVTHLKGVIHIIINNNNTFFRLGLSTCVYPIGIKSYFWVHCTAYHRPSSSITCNANGKLPISSVLLTCLVGCDQPFYIMIVCFVLVDIAETSKFLSYSIT